jgi:O-antigen/teichoic acid export membrane protein
VQDLRRSAVRGALASCACQGASLGLRIVSMVVLARLLSPADFGLVGMVTALTGLLAICKEAGLSNAAVQSPSITEEQLSTLFWINVTLGVGLAAVCIVGAPMVAKLYGEPRLFWIAVVIGISFVFHGLGSQHRAVLLRQMRIPTVGAIDIAAFVVSIVVAIAMAAAGYGYWALVANAIIPPAGSALGVWLLAGWIPRRPCRRSDVGRMLVYGGTTTVNGMVVYLAYNCDKILLGRFGGAEALGIYGRAFQLINLPEDGLNSAVGSAAFPTLSRVHEDPIRLRRYFLRIYGTFLSLTLPITMAFGLFATDIVDVFLGNKWAEAAPLFRLLAPTILVFALINPLGWLMFANGQVKRSLMIAMMIAGVTIPAYYMGLVHGARGVAAGFSLAMVAITIPMLYWARHGTLITMRDTFNAIAIPFASMLLAAGTTFPALGWFEPLEPALFRLSSASAVFFSIYGIILLFVFKQSSVYVELARQTGIWPKVWPFSSKLN